MYGFGSAMYVECVLHGHSGTQHAAGTAPCLHNRKTLLRGCLKGMATPSIKEAAGGRRFRRVPTHQHCQAKQ